MLLESDHDKHQQCKPACQFQVNTVVVTEFFFTIVIYTSLSDWQTYTNSLWDLLGCLVDLGWSQTYVSTRSDTWSSHKYMLARLLHPKSARQCLKSLQLLHAAEDVG